MTCPRYPARRTTGTIAGRRVAESCHCPQWSQARGFAGSARGRYIGAKGMTQMTHGGVRPGEGPRRPTQLHRRVWADTARRVWSEFKQDGLTDWAAALTYYGILSIFPGLLVLVSCLGLFGKRTTDAVQQTITSATPGEVGHILDSAINQVQQNRASAGIVAVVSILVAFWSASGYIAAFMR